MTNIAIDVLTKALKENERELEGARRELGSHELTHDALDRNVAFFENRSNELTTALRALRGVTDE